MFYFLLSLRQYAIQGQHLFKGRYIATDDLSQLLPQRRAISYY